MKKKRRNILLLITGLIILAIGISVFLLSTIKKEIQPPLFRLVDTSAVKSFTATKPGEKDQGTFKVIFKANSVKEDLRIDNSCKVDGLDSPGQGIEYTIGNTEIISCELSADTTNDKDTLYTFELEENKARNFTLTVVASAPKTGSTPISLKMKSVNFGRATDDTNAHYYAMGL